jgi:hypothetical protein
MTFIDTKATLNGIRDFACQYGEFRQWGPAQTEYDDWIVCLLRLRLANLIWSFIKTENRQALKPFFKWNPVGSSRVNSYLVFDTDFACSAKGVWRGFEALPLSWNSHDIIFRHLYPVVPGEHTDNEPALHLRHEMYDTQTIKRGDVVSAARSWLEAHVWLSVQGRVDPDFNLSDPARKPLSLVVNESLGAALWLQFALSISESRDHRKCQTCEQWFELAPGVHRADSRFCGEACRARAHRIRVASAQALHEKGMSIARIAKKLGATDQTIRGWIDKKPRQRKRRKAAAV